MRVWREFSYSCAFLNFVTYAFYSSQFSKSGHIQMQSLLVAWSIARINDVALLWHCCGMVVALLWHWCGIVVACMSLIVTSTEWVSVKNRPLSSITFINVIKHSLSGTQLFMCSQFKFLFLCQHSPLIMWYRLNWTCAGRFFYYSYVYFSLF